MQTSIIARLLGALTAGAVMLAACGAAPAEPQTASSTQTPTDTPERATAVASPTPQAQAAEPTPLATTPPSPGGGPTAPAGGEVVTRTLLLQEPRLQGDDVAAVQRRLLELGYTQVGLIDGVFGPQTERAVIAFQRTNDLAVDGVVGPQTGQRLFGADAVRSPEVAPVVDAQGGRLLGASAGGAWVGFAEAEALVRGGETYRLYTLAGLIGTAVGTPPEPVGPGPCDDTSLVTLDPQPIERAIAVAGDWEPQPRLPRELETSTDVLQQLVADQLSSRGIAQPEVNIEQALAVDLEGDGSEETLVAATRYTGGGTVGPSAAAGDYSLILLWDSEQGVAHEVAAEVYPEAREFVAPNSFEVLAILDLNGDGRMELVIASSYYEGGATEVYEVSAGQLQAVIGAACGV